jgi:hypothetical protein
VKGQTPARVLGLGGLGDLCKPARPLRNISKTTGWRHKDTFVVYSIAHSQRPSREYHTMYLPSPCLYHTVIGANLAFMY